MATEAFGNSLLSHRIHIQTIPCQKPGYLPYCLLRSVQRRIKENLDAKSLALYLAEVATHSERAPSAGEGGKGYGRGRPDGASAEFWRHVEYVYFTEFDQPVVLQSERVLETALRVVDSRGYVAPTRPRRWWNSTVEGDWQSMRNTTFLRRDAASSPACEL